MHKYISIFLESGLSCRVWFYLFGYSLVSFHYAQTTLKVTDSLLLEFISLLFVPFYNNHILYQSTTMARDRLAAMRVIRTTI